MLERLLVAVVAAVFLVVLVGRGDLVKRLAVIVLVIALIGAVVMAARKNARHRDAVRGRQTESSKLIGSDGAVILPSGRLHIVEPSRESPAN